MAKKKVVKEWTWDDYDPHLLEAVTFEGNCHDCKRSVPVRLEKGTGKTWCTPCWVHYVGTGGCSCPN